MNYGGYCTTIAFEICIGIIETFMITASVIAIATTPNVRLCSSMHTYIICKTILHHIFILFAYWPPGIFAHCD
jgi:hypothetical protein